MSTLLLFVLLGFCGLAIDMALVYNRKIDVQNIADAAALGAARRLNGTAGGINNAVTAAAAAVTALKYKYGNTSITWSAAAIRFSTTPDRDGPWVDAGSAAATPARMFYVRVDTRELADVGDVQTLLMPVLSSTFATVTARSDAIAGRSSINVAPLAVCAMSTIPASPRANSATNNELVEYGFRRGVSYDLMDLNPGGAAPANFVVNPVAAPGTVGSSSDLLPSKVAPYVCTGTLSIPRLTGDPISVGQPFPIGDLFRQLNSRFDQYDGGACTFNAAPPDYNIRSYNFNGNVPWMSTAAAGQTATRTEAGGKLQTMADLTPPTGTAAQYGPVWAFAKAVPFAAYAPGVPEPSSNGYATFTTTNWPVLYGGQTASSYPAGTYSSPYKATSGTNFLAPRTAHRPGVKGRRVLNVPLLNCSAPPGTTATVLAIGRFFMTVPATPARVAAEFAGSTPVQNIEGNVELFP